MAFGLMAFDIFLRLVVIERKTAVQWLPAKSAPLELSRCWVNFSAYDRGKFHWINRWQLDYYSWFCCSLSTSDFALSDATRYPEAESIVLRAAGALCYCCSIPFNATCGRNCVFCRYQIQRRPQGFFDSNGANAQAYNSFNMSWAAGSMIGPLLSGKSLGQRTFFL